MLHNIIIFSSLCIIIWFRQNFHLSIILLIHLKQLSSSVEKSQILWHFAVYKILAANESVEFEDTVNKKSKS